MKDILEKLTEEMAEKEAAKRELEVSAWIGHHGFRKLFFRRWLFVWCDMKNFKFKG